MPVHLVGEAGPEAGHLEIGDVAGGAIAVLRADVGEAELGITAHLEAAR